MTPVPPMNRTLMQTLYQTPRRLCSGRTDHATRIMCVMRGYGDDLAYIHDAAFSDYGRKATPGLLRILKRSGINGGLVIDLGCGSGRWAHELNRKGYAALGVDQSPAFIRLARKNSAAIQVCVRVAVEGEVAGVRCRDVDRRVFELFLRSQSRQARTSAPVRRVYCRAAAGRRFYLRCGRAQPNPRRATHGEPHRKARIGRFWSKLRGTNDATMLTRRIISFRKTGSRYRRSEEIHRLQLYRAAEIVEMLNRTGFHVECLKGYGRFRLPVGIAAFVARK